MHLIKALTTGRAHRNIGGPLGPPWAHLGPLGAPVAPWGHLGPQGATWDHLGALRTALAWLACLLCPALAWSGLGLPCLPCLGLVQQQQPAAFGGRRRLRRRCCCCWTRQACCCWSRQACCCWTRQAWYCFGTDLVPGTRSVLMDTNRN